MPERAGAAGVGGDHVTQPRLGDDGLVVIQSRILRRKAGGFVRAVGHRGHMPLRGVAAGLFNR